MVCVYVFINLLNVWLKKRHLDLQDGRTSPARYQDFIINCEVWTHIDQIDRREPRWLPILFGNLTDDQIGKALNKWD